MHHKVYMRYEMLLFVAVSVGVKRSYDNHSLYVTALWIALYLRNILILLLCILNLNFPERSRTYPTSDSVLGR